MSALCYYIPPAEVVASRSWIFWIDDVRYDVVCEMKHTPGCKPRIVIVVDHGGHLDTTPNKAIIAIVARVKEALEISRGDACFLNYFVVGMLAGRPKTTRVGAYVALGPGLKWSPV